MRTIPEVSEEIKKILNDVERTQECDGETLVAIDELVNEILTINSLNPPCYLGSPCEYQSETANINHGWIPCSERLPDEELDNAKKERGEMAVFPVLATIKRKNNIIVSKVFYSGFGGNRFIDYQAEKLDVIAWQPLPSPYKPVN